jgi:hypothetical protein
MLDMHSHLTIHTITAIRAEAERKPVRPRLPRRSTGRHGLRVFSRSARRRSDIATAC